MWWAAACAAVAQKPNVLLIVADDQGYANIGYHNKTVLTPRIDALAADGVSVNIHARTPCFV